MSDKAEKKSVSRRSFIGIAAGATVGATVLLSGAKKTVALLAGASGTGGPSGEALLMHNDLQRALQKPISERKWVMVIDARKCIGCHACTVACIAENNLPPGVSYRTVAETEDGEYPSIKRFFMPTNCMQCGNPPCVEAANKVIPGAMSKRPDGIVIIDYKKMKGPRVFEAAAQACPYPHSLSYDEGKNHTDGTPALQPYEKRLFREYGRNWNRKDTKDSTRKCHFCTQRLDAGVLPACVTACTGQAMHFGDLNDKESLVANLLNKNKSTRLNLANGTEPSIFYLDDDPEQTCMVCHS